ncbi:MAG: lamin tail domain-containing protein [Acidobacteriota bacterium]
MLRSVRMSLAAIAVVVVLLTMQSGVEAKKKNTKRRHETAQSVPLVIVRPTFTPATPAVSNNNVVNSSDDFVNRSGPAARVAPSASTSGGGLTTDGVGDSAGSGKKGRGGISIDPIPAAPLAGSLIISEFRLRGPAGANDEFVEIYNDSGANHTVTAVSGTGYAIAASDGVTRCTIPNATVIPARGHYLCVNSVGYSLATYPAGNGTGATGDATYATDIPDNAGIALFNNNSGGGSYSLANRFDAVGSTSEANTIYKEGTGYTALTPFSIDYAFVRDECGKGGSITTMGPCAISTPKDTDDNAVDFIFVDTNGTSAGAGQRLGAPGPQNLSSPIQRNSTIGTALLDATVASSSAPNRVRDFTSVPAQNSTFGTLSIRRRFVNNTGANITRLRFRIIDLTTFPAPSGIADLRPRTSSAVVVAGINDSGTCTAAGQSTPCSVTVQGTTLEQPPSQPNGGGFNSSLSAGTITLGTPLANGASIDVQFLLGLQQTGNFRIYVNLEALP